MVEEKEENVEVTPEETKAPEETAAPEDSVASNDATSTSDSAEAESEDAATPQDATEEQPPEETAPATEEIVEEPKEEIPAEPEVVEETPSEPEAPAEEPKEEEAAPEVIEEAAPEPVDTAASEDAADPAGEAPQEEAKGEEPAEESKEEAKEEAPAEESKEEAAPAEDAPAEEETSAEPEVQPASEDKSSEKPKKKAPAKKKPTGIVSPPLFGKYDLTDINVSDKGLERYINLNLITIPHVSGRHANKPFAKAKVSIVERLINGMMRTERYTGKKSKTHKVVEGSFDIINKRTKENPVQVLINALQNTAPREEVTRLRFGGISVPKAVDIAPCRRLDLALRNICKGAIKSSHKNKRSISDCLAGEIMAAAKNDMNSFAISKKEEIERVAKSAR